MNKRYERLYDKNYVRVQECRRNRKLLLMAVIGMITCIGLVSRYFLREEDYKREGKEDLSKSLMTEMEQSDTESDTNYGMSENMSDEAMQTELSASISKHEDIQNVINEIAEEYGAIGIQVAVIENGIPTDTYAYGWATIDQDIMTAEHKMRVASISKVVIGVAAMLLQEDGTINLDESIGDYWNTTVQNPRYPDIPVTVRDILTHTSTIICYDDYVLDYESIRERLRYGYIDSSPGLIESWSYNNYAFGVLGMTLELAAEKKMDTILDEKLYQILDIDAAFAAGDINDTERIVTLYREGGEIARSVETQINIHMPEEFGTDGSYFAGGLTISASDLAKLVGLLASDGVYNGIRLVQAETINQIESSFSETLPNGSYQATPLFCCPMLYGRKLIYYHTGTAYGANNCISYDPESGDGVVVLSTGAYGDTDQYGINMLCSEINEYIYKQIAE